MKRFTSLASALVAGASLVLAACQADVLAPAPADRTLDPVQATRAVGAVAAQAIRGEYIVQFKPGVSSLNGAPGLMVAAERGRLRHVYSAALVGFAATLSDDGAQRIARHPHVLAVVPDVKVTLATSGTQSSAPWGLDRIDQRALPLGSTFAYANDGAGVTVYVVDTGVNYGHVDFGGRAVTGFDAVTSGGTAADCHGHGTHVAGTVGGTKYGVAKGARLVGVRVLDCAGNGTSSGVIAGLDWVLKQKQADPSLSAVVNMSLGGGASSAIDAAVDKLVSAGVATVVAAGNSSADACTSSPARVAAAITVGATDASDRFASFSNHGPCVDLQAPGVGIASTYIGSTTAVASMNGTSMAAPHVAGAAALVVAANPSATPAQVASALTGNATANVVVGAPANTANRLLYVGFLAGTTPPPNSAPTATISAPAAGTSVTQGTAVTFTGAGSDPEDGALAGTSLVWTSSVQGTLGTGASLTTSGLAVGTHTITLTAKDGQGATGTAARTITVTAATAPAVARVLVYAKSGIGSPTWTMKVGATAQFAAVAYDANGRALSMTGRTVSFTSTAPTVFSIDSATGLGKGVAPGYFAVRATVDGVTGSTGNMIVAP